MGCVFWGVRGLISAGAVLWVGSSGGGARSLPPGLAADSRDSSSVEVLGSSGGAQFFPGRQRGRTHFPSECCVHLFSVPAEDMNDGIFSQLFYSVVREGLL